MIRALFVTFRKMGMGRGSHFDENVAGRSAVDAGFALTAETDFLAVLDAGRNLHLQCFHLAVATADGNLCFAAQHGRGEGNRQFVFNVRAAGWSLAARLLASAALAELFEQVSETASASASSAEEIFEVDVNVRPAAPGVGPRLGPGAAGAHRLVGAAVAIVHLAFLGVAQHVEGALHLLESLFCPRVVGVQIGMVFARKLTVSLADIVLGG